MLVAVGSTQAGKEIARKAWSPPVCVCVSNGAGCEHIRCLHSQHGTHTVYSHAKQQIATAGPCTCCSRGPVDCWPARKSPKLPSATEGGSGRCINKTGQHQANVAHTLRHAVLIVAAGTGQASNTLAYPATLCKHAITLRMLCWCVPSSSVGAYSLQQALHSTTPSSG